MSIGKRKDGNFYPKNNHHGISSNSIESDNNIHSRLYADSQAKMIMISSDLDSAKQWNNWDEQNKKRIAEQIRTNNKEINEMTKKDFMDLTLIQQEDVLNEINKNNNIIENRINELEEGHKVKGGTHNPKGYCPTCNTINKLQSLKEGNKEYPDSLTFDEFDNMPFHKTKQFEDPKKAKAYAEKIGGQIYSQVDGDEDRLYSKGMRFVNTTGLYEVVKIPGYRVDNN